MNESIDALVPQALWAHFRALSAIPRGSKNEAAAARHVLDLAKRLGLPARQDAVGNVVVAKPATKGKESSPVTVLQGHLDMVCEKNSDVPHDFTKDPIRLLRDGDFVKACGTTLGADNGMGVCAALAVLESKDLPHPPLECLFTIDEETGLTGAFHLEAGMLKGTQMLNLDTEEEGAVYIGCAGGLDTVMRTDVRLVPPGAGRKAYRLAVTGLRGGHSGVDIHEGRPNAIKLLARVLRRAPGAHGAKLASLWGGSKRNALPREAFALLMLDPKEARKLAKELETMQAEARVEFGKNDAGITFALAAERKPPAKVFSGADAQRVVSYLHTAPHGVVAMSPDIPGLVQTSTNLAIVETDGKRVTVATSQRSSIAASKREIGDVVAAHAEMAGFAVEQGHGYPGWAPNVSSPLLAKAKKVHAGLFGAEPAVKAIHAGLECGIISEKLPGMDVISFGPTIQNAHSPDERVSVPSVAKFWEYLKAMLAAA